MEVPAMALRLLSRANRRRAMDDASFSLEWLPLAANAVSAKATFTIPERVDFVALEVFGTATDLAFPPVDIGSPQATINFQLPDRNVFDKPAHWRHFLGVYVGTPFPLPFPWWISRSTTVTGVLTNLTATPANFRVVIAGFILHPS